MQLAPDIQDAVNRLLSASSLSEVQKIAESLSAVGTSPNGVLYSGRVYGSTGYVSTVNIAVQFAHQSGATIINSGELVPILVKTSMMHRMMVLRTCALDYMKTKCNNAEYSVFRNRLNGIVRILNQDRRLGVFLNPL